MIRIKQAPKTYTGRRLFYNRRIGVQVVKDCAEGDKVKRFIARIEEPLD
jgi:hypothetical protein